MKLYLLGFMGSGKSHVGKKLSARLQLPFLDLDDFIVEREGMSINEIFACKGEHGFRQIERKCLEETAEMDNAIIGCGGGTPCFFDNMEWLNKHGTTWYLNYPASVLFDRLKTRKAKRPLLKDMSDEQLLSFIEKKLEERAPYYEAAQFQYNYGREAQEAATVIEEWHLKHSNSANG